MTYGLQMLELSQNNNIYICINFRFVLWTQGQLWVLPTLSYSHKKFLGKALISLSLEGLGNAHLSRISGRTGHALLFESWWSHGRKPRNTIEFPLVGRWSWTTLTFSKILRCHVAKGKIQRLELKNLFSNQQAGSATSSQKEFQMPEVLAKIMGKFASYLSFK